MREAVEQARAAGAHQVRLAAAARRMRGVPRNIAAARAVVMTHLRAALAFARPVLARVISAIGERFAFRGRARQNVVNVRGVTGAVDLPINSFFTSLL